MKKIIEESISESARIINNSVTLSGNIEKSILEITKTLRNGKKIILFGNGGSAADAQHIAAELIGRFKLKRNSLPAISLTTDSSTITSIANDFSFDEIFSRQCESLVSNGDIVKLSEFTEATGIEVDIQPFPFRELLATIEVRGNAKADDIDVEL